MKSENKQSEPKWWKPYWIILVIVIMLLGITMPLFTSIPFETSITYMIITLIGLGIAYLGRLKQSLILNRSLYLLLGSVIGAFIWMICIPIFRIITASDELVYVIITLVACVGVGVIIGDLIGRARNYKGPGRYQP